MDLEQFYVITSTLYIFAMVLSVFLTIFVWRRRHVADVRYFLVSVILITIWYLAAVIAFFSPTPEFALFWKVKVKFFSVATIPVSFLVFVLNYTGHIRWLKTRYLVLLCVIPAITQIITWTNSPLFITDFVFQRFGPYLIEVDMVFHEWFWVHTFYSYCLIAVTLVLLVLFALRSSYPYRPQAFIMMAGALAVILANMLFVFGVVTPAPPESTALTFGGVALVWTWALFRYRLFDIMPVARHAVIESMSDAVIVLDVQNRIVDLNPTARALAHYSSSNMVGKFLGEIWPEQKELIEIDTISKETETEIVIDIGDDQHIFDLDISTLYQRRGIESGRLVVLRNITQRKRFENQLKEMNVQLTDQLDENERLRKILKEQAIHDPLTNLHNRRYFEDHLTKLISRTKRTREPFSIVMIDIDEFKQINDTYGHNSGDEVLKSLSALLKSNTRQEDIVCRYAGDEFIIVLLGTDCQAALERAESWRSKFENTPIEIDGKLITSTLSIGVAEFSDGNQTVDKVVKRVDKALYRSKTSGRNRVTLSES